jgi:hypothetical protein
MSDKNIEDALNENIAIFESTLTEFCGGAMKYGVSQESIELAEESIRSWLGSVFAYDDFRLYAEKIILIFNELVKHMIDKANSLEDKNLGWERAVDVAIKARAYFSHLERLFLYRKDGHWDIFGTSVSFLVDEFERAIIDGWMRILNDPSAYPSMEEASSVWDQILLENGSVRDRMPLEKS